MGRVSVRAALLVDLGLWVVLCAAGVVGFRESAAPSVPRDLVLPALLLGVAVPLSRRRPGCAVLLANVPCALGLAGATSPANAYVPALAVLSCLLGARAGTVRGPLLVLAGCLAVDLAVCAVLRAGAVWWFYAVTVLPAALLLPWLVGQYWRVRGQLVRGGWRLARVLEERQHVVAEQARLKERAQIAADTHDALGHLLSLVALRAGALELSPTLTGQDQADAAELRATVADAVDQLRETLTVLREAPEAGVGPAPAERVEDLLRRAADSGVPVEWERTGPDPTLSPLVERGVHRVVREAVTNATKHAPGATIRVTLTHDTDRTRVRVTNSPPPGGPHPAPASARLGLAGLRERVAVLGGTLHAGPHQGGYELRATLPHEVRGRGSGPYEGAVAPDAYASGAVPLSGPYDGRAAGPYEAREAGESVRRLSDVRRRARLRFAAAVAAPGCAALVFLPTAALLAYQLSDCVLPPTGYEKLRVGQRQAAFAHLLPERTFPYPSDRVRSVPQPPGATCDFYRSGSSLLDEADVYRLCYADSRLVAKDTLPGGSG